MSSLAPPAGPAAPQGAPPAGGAPARPTPSPPAATGNAGPRPALTAAALATAGAALGLQVSGTPAWRDSWLSLADVFVSLWLLLFVGLLVALWTAGAAVALLPGGARPAADVTPRRAPAALRPRVALAWAACLLAICMLEVVSHAGERNGFLASSRPESGVEAWTSADGYATLLDGTLAQGDGLFLLPMLNTFLGDGTPGPSEYDRRAGHLYLVALLQRPLGTYWGFAGLNLLSWWGAALGVWWLGRRRWPGTSVPWLAALFVTTGQGFVFMGTAPQPHAVAYGALVLLLVLAEALGLWGGRVPAAAGLKLGWATGAAGLVYFVHIPALLFFWLQGAAVGLRGGRLRALALATLVTAGLLTAWQVYGSATLGLSFAGGNNDYAGEAVARWRQLLGQGPPAVLDQLHTGSLRGIFVGAFYYPWWALAVLGLLVSPPGARRWALALFVAAAIPAIAFSIRFHLPRLAFFTFPAVYLLAAAGTAGLAGVLGGGSRRREAAVAGVILLALALLSNADLFGWQRFNVWFHYGQGASW